MEYQPGLVPVPKDRALFFRSDTDSGLIVISLRLPSFLDIRDNRRRIAVNLNKLEEVRRIMGVECLEITTDRFGSYNQENGYTVRVDIDEVAKWILANYWDKGLRGPGVWIFGINNFVTNDLNFRFRCPWEILKQRRIHQLCKEGLFEVMPMRPFNLVV